MNTRLARWVIVVLLLLGGVLIWAQATLAAPSTAFGGPFPEQARFTTQATTLTLSFSGTLFMTPVGLGHDRGLVDLWDYTTYDDDKTNLVYTATPFHVGIVDVQIVDSHYLSVTAVATYERYDRVTIEVSDGALSASAELRIELVEPPSIRFRTGSLFDLPDPVYLVAGQPSFLTMPGGEDRVPLEYYSSDDVITYSISNPPPSGTLGLGLGVRIVLTTGPGCSYAECHYVSFDPARNMSGKIPIWVEVQNSAGFTATDVFTVAVLQRVFLPAVMRNYSAVPHLHPIDNPDGDGDYELSWDPPSDYPTDYEVEFSYNDPTFANGQVATTSYTWWGGYFTWPGTHYWRVRAHYYKWEQDHYVDIYSAWSNTQSANVGAFAYLWIDSVSHAHEFSVEISGNGIHDTVTFPPVNDYTGEGKGYWRSVPVGTYLFNLTSEWIWTCPNSPGGTRSEQRTLGNTVEQGAWYTIEPCSIGGPALDHP